MAKQGTLLIVDDNKSILSALNILLSNVFEKVHTISSPTQIISSIREHKVDIVLLDMNFVSGINSGNEGLFWLSEIKRYFPTGCEVVLFTAYADIELAIKGMKLGACDFVVKPWDNSHLISTLENAHKRSSQQGKAPATNTPTFIAGSNRMYWGVSKEMQKLRELVEKVAATDANILIIGENGTGKEVLAREIHIMSKRANGNMVTVDMGAITETLFESELFGHVKGAFTDAKADRVGKFELANAGSLFMDEIGNLPLHLQSKLLAVLQTRKVTRVGSNKLIDIDIRLISATNQNIEQMVDESKFRMDLMYRLNTITITLVPLRERKEDITPLTLKFMNDYSTKYNKHITSITTEAKKALAEHSWSGNIRELQHTIEKAVIMCTGDTLELADLLLKQSVKSENSINTQQLDSGTLEDMERVMIINTIDKHNSNLSMAAASLGISRQTLYNKMKKYNL